MSSRSSSYVVPKFTSDSDGSKFLTCRADHVNSNDHKNKLLVAEPCEKRGQGEVKVDRHNLTVMTGAEEKVPGTGKCLVCRKESVTNLATQRCACTSRFMHDECLVVKLLQTLDKPCPMCGQFFSGSLINSRLNLTTDEPNRAYVCQRNAAVFKCIFASLLAAYFILEHIFTQPESQGEFFFFYQQFCRMLVLPFMHLLATILIYKLFQNYLQSPTNLYYFTNSGRMVAFSDPLTQNLMKLYVRSHFGLLVDTTTGKGRFINKHLVHIKPKWRLHRLMEP